MAWQRWRPLLPLRSGDRRHCHDASIQMVLIQVYWSWARISCAGANRPRASFAKRASSWSELPPGQGLSLSRKQESPQEASGLPEWWKLQFERFSCHELCKRGSTGSPILDFYLSAARSLPACAPSMRSPVTVFLSATKWSRETQHPPRLPFSRCPRQAVPVAGRSDDIGRDAAHLATPQRLPALVAPTWRLL